MKTTYLVWKNPTRDGINPSWRELSGQEFLALVRSAEVTGRYFVKLENAEDGTAIIIESTRASYLAWKKEKRRREYLKACAGGKPAISYHALALDGGCSCEELLEDKAADVLTECLVKLTRETLKAALASLTADEYRLISYLYLAEEAGTIREYANLTGKKKSTIGRRKSAILQKMKDFFENNVGQIRKSWAIE